MWKPVNFVCFYSGCAFPAGPTGFSHSPRWCFWEEGHYVEVWISPWMVDNDSWTTSSYKTAGLSEARLKSFKTSKGTTVSCSGQACTLWGTAPGMDFCLLVLIMYICSCDSKSWLCSWFLWGTLVWEVRKTFSCQFYVPKRPDLKLGDLINTFSVKSLPSRNLIFWAVFFLLITSNFHRVWGNW
jgi:hypothetical protein